jgi:uncharacterized protein YtpQ (UPF0354 family)
MQDQAQREALKMEKRTKMTMEQRAKIFLPFNGLRGYYDLILNVDKKREPKRELSDDELNELSAIFNMLKKRMIVEAIYYFDDGYTKIKGMISKINVIKRVITIIKTDISFDDILKIKIEE